MLGGAEAKLLQ